MSEEKQTSDTGLTPEVIRAAFERLFSGEKRGVRRFARSDLRWVALPNDAALIEQNTKRRSKWAEMALSGHRIAWAIRDGQFLARVVDGEVEMLQ
ncbi:MAG: hypothetical protein LC754_01265 [Acidobacteria bacterium]|nr:hypothetical protein [Acidobacteriota bacterium]